MPMPESMREIFKEFQKFYIAYIWKETQGENEP